MPPRGMGGQPLHRSYVQLVVGEKNLLFLWTPAGTGCHRSHWPTINASRWSHRGVGVNPLAHFGHREQRYPQGVCRRREGGV